MRDATLPLFDPPEITLEGWTENGTVRVIVRGLLSGSELSWDGPCVRHQVGQELCWSPRSQGDRLTVVARHPGGVASASLLASDVHSG